MNTPDSLNLKRAHATISVGRMSYEAGYFRQAAHHFRSALTWLDKTDGSDVESRSQALIGLAKSLAAVGDFDAAEELIGQAVILDRSGPCAGEAEDYHQMSLLYWRSGRTEMAMRCAQRAMELAEADPATPDELIVKLLKHFAVLAEGNGALDECERNLNLALETIDQSTQLDKQSSIYGDILLVKVLMLCEQGRMSEASELYDQAITIVEMNRGISHPRVREVLDLFKFLSSGTGALPDKREIKDAITSAHEKSQHGII